MPDSIPMTPQGHEALSVELRRLKTVERPDNIRAIEEARAHGDLSENAEYHAAKERQGMLDARIRDLEYKLGAAQIIDPKNAPRDRVVFGVTVLLENLDTEEEVTYQILGPEESDVKNGKISVTSPLGKALLGKKPDDDVVVQTPSGLKRFCVVEIL
ncbi:MAG: transcription elongation factor GreA [Desulfatibacillaceae bacterium]|nr:transcription elongation factor GreA [Desulfatibacillaceae bacterium]